MTDCTGCTLKICYHKVGGSVPSCITGDMENVILPGPLKVIGVGGDNIVPDIVVKLAAKRGSDGFCLLDHLLDPPKCNSWRPCYYPDLYLHIAGLPAGTTGVSVGARGPGGDHFFNSDVFLLGSFASVKCAPHGFGLCGDSQEYEICFSIKWTDSDGQKHAYLFKLPTVTLSCSSCVEAVAPA